MAQHGRTVKQSYCETVYVMILFNYSCTAVESPFQIGCAFSVCTGVETVKQSLNSIETNQELFHSLNAHHHNAN